MVCNDYPAGYQCSGPAYNLTCAVAAAPAAATQSSSDTANNSSSNAGNFTNQGSAGLNCDNKGNCTYVPLEPIPTFDQSQPTDLGSFLVIGFRIIFTLSALLAVGMFTFAGIEYMVSDVAPVKTKAREQAWAAIYGVLILAGSYLILNTINPQLLNFNFQPNDSTYGSAVGTNSTTGTADTSGSGSPSLGYWQSYTADSSSGAAYSSALNYQLQNTPSMGALMVIDKSHIQDATSVDARNTFYSQCKSVGGIPYSGNTTTGGYQVNCRVGGGTNTQSAPY